MGWTNAIILKCLNRVVFQPKKKNNEKYLIVTARNSQSMGLSGHFKHLVLFVATIDNCLSYCINFLLLATCLAFFCHENLFVSRAKNWKFHAVPVAILADWNHFSFNLQKKFSFEKQQKINKPFEEASIYNLQAEIK